MNTNQSIERRFKILYLLVLQTGAKNLLRQMDTLAEKIEANDPQVPEAMDFFERKIIEILEAPASKLNTPE